MVALCSQALCRAVYFIGYSLLFFFSLCSAFTLFSLISSISSLVPAKSCVRSGSGGALKYSLKSEVLFLCKGVVCLFFVVLRVTYECNGMEPTVSTCTVRIGKEVHLS